MKEGKEIEKDIFQKAQEQSMAQLIEKEKENSGVIVSNISDKEGVVDIIKERLSDGETQWDRLKKMVDGSLTEKFIDILYNMPDRDFARNYLKLLEHFKPKITRDEGATAVNDDKEITVKIKQLDMEGVETTIDITGLQNFEDGLQE